MGEKLPEKKPAAGAVDAFLQKLAAMPTVRPVGPRGRLIFALDATASRQPSWDQACLIQAEMFAAVGQSAGSISNSSITAASMISKPFPGSTMRRS